MSGQEQGNQEQDSHRQTGLIDRVILPLNHKGRVLRNVVLTTTALWLAACGRQDITPTVEATPVPTVPTPTEFAPTPSPSPTEAYIATEQVTAYGPPSLSAAEFFPNSGGSNRDALVLEMDLLFPGLGEGIVANHENALRSWAGTDVNIDYIVNGESFDNSRWTISARSAGTGNRIWPQRDGSLIEVPYAFVLDESGNVIMDPSLTPFEIPGTAGSEVRFVNKDQVALLDGETVPIGTREYYTEWVNTQTFALTGAPEPIPAVAEAVRTQWQVYENGLAPDLASFPDLPAGQLPDLIAHLKTLPSNLDPDAAEWVWESPTASGRDASMAKVRLYPSIRNCEIVSSVRMVDGEETYYLLLWRILNKDGTESIVTFGIGNSPVEDMVNTLNDPGRIISRLQQYQTKVKMLDFTIIYQINDPNIQYWFKELLPESLRPFIFQWMETGIMPAELEGVVLPGYISSGAILYNNP